MTTAEREDVVDLLVDQHAQIKELFAAALMARPGAREESFYALVHLLAIHEAAEEQLVHPVARMSTSAGDRVVDARLQEEQHAKQALSDLYELGVDHPDYLRELAALRDAVVEHATSEEQEEFPRLRQQVPAERRERLAQAIRMVEVTAPTRPHPAVQSPVANMMLGPPLAVFDRVRDAIRDARSRGQD